MKLGAMVTDACEVVRLADDAVHCEPVSGTSVGLFVSKRHCEFSSVDRPCPEPSLEI
jgi:hypothetical protein